eukprot:Em0004g323a
MQEKIQSPLFTNSEEERKKTLLSELEAISLSKTTALTIQKEQFEKMIGDIGHYTDLASHILQTHTDHEIVALGGLIPTELQATLERVQTISLTPNQESSITVSVQTDDLIQKLSKLGHLLDFNLSPSSSTWTPTSVARVGTWYHVKVQSKTSKREECPHGDVEVKGEMRSKTHNGAVVYGEVEDHRDGTYTITLTPQTAGPHQLLITMDGQHVQNSPNDLDVRPKRDYRILCNAQQVIQCNRPTCVAIHDNGDIYVGSDDGCIYVFDQTGQLKNTIGSSGSGDGQFSSPCGISIKGDVLYVADTYKHRVQKLTSSGKFLHKFGQQGSGLDPQGNIHVAANGSNTIKVFTKEGVYVRMYGDPNRPIGIAIDDEGYSLVSEWDGNCLSIYDPDGNKIHTVENLNNPYDWHGESNWWGPPPISRVIRHAEKCGAHGTLLLGICPPLASDVARCSVYPSHGSPGVFALVAVLIADIVWSSSSLEIWIPAVNVGMPRDNGEGDFPNEGHVVKDSDNCFTVWCTGRTGCDWMMAQLRFVAPGNDCMSPARPHLYPLLPPSQLTAPAEARSVHFAAVSGTPSPDTVKNYSTIVRTKDLDSSLMVVSDSSEAVILLLSNQIVAFLNKNASSVEYIHLSDLYTGAALDSDDTESVPDKVLQNWLQFSYQVWLELLSALAFDGITPSSVPLYGGGGGMTPSSVPLYGGGGVTSAQNLQSFVQFALSLLDHIKSIRLTRELCGSRILLTQLCGSLILLTQLCGSLILLTQLCGSLILLTQLCGSLIILIQLCGSLILLTQLCGSLILLTQLCGSPIILTQLCGSPHPPHLAMWFPHPRASSSPSYVVLPSSSPSYVVLKGKEKVQKGQLKVTQSLEKLQHSQRQEAAQLRKEDKKKAEKEKILNEPDPEKTRKYMWEEIASILNKVGMKYTLDDRLDAIATDNGANFVEELMENIVKLCKSYPTAVN